MSVLPFVDGLLSRADVGATAATIAAAQEPSGAIPWVPGQHADVWNHVEAAMGLLIGGEDAAAERAYLWAPRHQRPDGSWPMKVVGDTVTDARGDTNFSAYLAVGVWHHWLSRRDLDLVRELWPSVRAGLDWVVSQQQAFGGIRWTPGEELCLLTGNASIYQSLRAGVAIAELLGQPQAEWELTGGRLGHALRRHRDQFADKSTFAMDWYYPVLGGAVRDQDARVLLAARWSDFVVPGLGVRCVSTNPWVTGAETCELVLALDSVGEHARARRLLAEVQHLRTRSGAYWTGWVYADPAYPNDNPDAFWPEEQSTFTAAAVLLAVDALGERYGAATPGSGIMRGSSLAPHFAEIALECGCPSPAEVRGR